MKAHALIRILTFALIAALALPGLFHVMACDGMMCTPGVTARSHASTPLDACNFAVCTFRLISVSALGVILNVLTDRLSESTPFLRTISLLQPVPPPRSA